MSVFGDIVKACDGKFLGFNQSKYCKLDIAAMYHAVETDDGTPLDQLGGLCTGLCAAWCMVHKKCRDSLGPKELVEGFVAYIKSGDGAAVVATIQADSENGFRKNGAVGAEVAVTDFFSEGLGFRSLKHEDTTMPVGGASAAALSQYVNGAKGYVMIGFDVHEVSAIHAVVGGKPQIIFFEPNYGFAFFTGIAYLASFRDFATGYFSSKCGARYIGSPMVLSRFN